MPERIQLRRVKGWRKPDGAVVVARPSRWGNPYRVVPDGSLLGEPLFRVEAPAGFDRAFLGGEHPRTVAASQAVDQFLADLLENLLRPGFEEDYLTPLIGHDLACWCPPGVPCHADVLLAIANA